MDIRVAGHQVATGESLRSHVSDRLSAIADRYFSRAVAANVTFGRGPYEDFTCDIVAPVNQGVVLKSSNRAGDAHVAFDGAAALEAFAEYEPALVLLDIGMPDMDGYEVARRIRAAFPERKATIVALTGWGQEEDRRKAREAGVDRHLIKPADVGALQALLALPARRR